MTDFGFLQGASQKWLLVSNVLLVIMMVIVPSVFLPYNWRLEALLQTARSEGHITPELKAALHDTKNQVAREAGLEWTVAVGYEMKGIIARHRKHHAEARILFENAFHAYQELGASFNVIIARSALAHMERRLGNHAIALDIYRETIVTFRDVG